MTLRKTLCALVAAAVIELAGCSEKQETQKDIKLFGKPVSVAYAIDTEHAYGAFAAVFNVEGKMLLAYKIGSNIQPTGHSPVIAAALLQSEIDDGDNELVKLTGQYVFTGLYKGDDFELSSIEANGYTIKLKE